MAQPKVNGSVAFPTSLEAFNLSGNCNFSSISGITKRVNEQFDAQIRAAKRASESCVELSYCMLTTEETINKADNRLLDTIDRLSGPDPVLDSIMPAARRHEETRQIRAHLQAIPSELQRAFEDACKTLQTIKRGDVIQSLSFLPREKLTDKDLSSVLSAMLAEKPRINVAIITTSRSAPAIGELDMPVRKVGRALETVLNRLRKPILFEKDFDNEMRIATGALIDALLEALPIYSNFEIWKCSGDNFKAIRDILRFDHHTIKGALRVCGDLIDPSRRDHSSMLNLQKEAALKEHFAQIEAWSDKVRTSSVAASALFSPAQRNALTPLAKEVFGYLFASGEKRGLRRSNAGPEALKGAAELRKKHLAAMNAAEAGQIETTLSELLGAKFISIKDSKILLKALGKLKRTAERKITPEEKANAELRHDYLLSIGVTDETVLNQVKKASFDQKAFDKRLKELNATLNYNTKAEETFLAIHPDLLLMDEALFKEFLDKLGKAVSPVYAGSLQDHPQFSFENAQNLSMQRIELMPLAVELVAVAGIEAFEALTARSGTPAGKNVLNFKPEEFEDYLKELKDFLKKVGHRIANLPEFNPARCPENFASRADIRNLSERFEIEQELKKIKLDPDLALKILRAVRDNGKLGGDYLPLPAPEWIDEKIYNAEAVAQYKLLMAFGAIDERGRELSLNIETDGDRAPRYEALQRAIHWINARPKAEPLKIFWLQLKEPRNDWQPASHRTRRPNPAPRHGEMRRNDQRRNAW